MNDNNQSRRSWKSPLRLPQLNSKKAADLLRQYIFSSDEPPLSQLLALLLYREADGPLDGIEYDGHVLHDQTKLMPSIGYELLFKKVRVYRIIQAVLSGEADQKVRKALQHELNRTVLGCMIIFYPYWTDACGWLKKRIIGCFDEESVKAYTLKKEFNDHAVKNGFIMFEKFDLDELLNLPLGDLYAEKK